MTSEAWKPEHVHLVGSIGLDTVQEVFHTCGSLLGKRLKRIPDGEPGGRRLWCSWQTPVLRASPYLKLSPGQDVLVFGMMELADGVKPADVHFGELGYSREARASYQDFLDAKKKGFIAEGTRFQVSLPTPVANLITYLTPETFRAIEEPYTQAMLREIDAICEAIPRKDLAFQWDVCLEMCIWDETGGGFFKWPGLGEAKSEIIARMKRLCDAVPRDVELGVHLCYGDLDAKHFFNPKDAGAMVEITNRIVAAVERPLNWVHMPVPIDRDDDAFFKPFDGLKLKHDTEIYLGMVHPQDGAEGVARRARAARGHLKEFGIATECGMARSRTSAFVRDLIKIHAESAREPA